jgi:hypothetical protein
MPAATMTIGNMLVTKRQRIGGLGSLMLILGAFAPLVSMPIVGNVSYFNNGSGDGMFILAAALLSLLILYRKKYQYQSHYPTHSGEDWVDLLLPDCC